MNGQPRDTADERRQAVIRAVAYAEENLREPIAVGEMAAAAGYSVFHFCRVFNEVAGQTPFDYVMRRRLSEAALELLRTELRVIDVAVEFQFGSAEAFCRAFVRAHEMTPSEWRRRGNVAASSILNRFEAPL